MQYHEISPDELGFDRISRIMREGLKLSLSDRSVELVRKCREYLDNKLEKTQEPLYGINTGFGSLYDCLISKEDLGILQKNLVLSHACGQGDEIPQEITRLMLFLKIQSLAYGNSGIQADTIRRMVDFFNEGITPVIYSYGSLGASGDLAPLAHLSLPLIGEGEVYYKGKKKSADEVLKQLKWEPVTLASKEGLALLNGTQFMSAYGVYCCLRVFKLSQLADIISAISLDAFDGRIEPFHPLVQEIRPYQGQIKTARRIRFLLEGSELINREKNHVQDPYSGAYRRSTAPPRIRSITSHMFSRTRSTR
jgi:histidine ammonia-lyase